MTTDRDPARAAIGVYLRARARRAGRTDDDAARALGVSASTVQRVYAGTTATDGMVMLRLMQLVGGDPAHLLALLADPSPELAGALAAAPAIPPPALDLAARIERAAAADPGLIAAVEGFIAGRESRG